MIPVVFELIRDAFMLGSMIVVSRRKSKQTHDDKLFGERIRVAQEKRRKTELLRELKDYL